MIGGRRESCEWRASAQFSERASEEQGRGGPIQSSIGAASAKPWCRCMINLPRSKPKERESGGVKKEVYPSQRQNFGERAGNGRRLGIKKETLTE